MKGFDFNKAHLISESHEGMQSSHSHCYKVNELKYQKYFITKNVCNRGDTILRQRRAPH